MNKPPRKNRPPPTRFRMEWPKGESYQSRANASKYKVHPSACSAAASLNNFPARKDFPHDKQPSLTLAALKRRRGKVYVIYAEQTTAADGTIIIRPLRKVMPGADMTVPEAARALRRHARTIQRMCDMGYFKGAYKPGRGPQAHWLIPRAEVLERFTPPAD
ncbi:MAG: hypothetical protein JWR19_2922 [Pedosphaera sp.]|nr:hypothetical protein [Pedosphaera sp.]